VTGDATPKLGNVVVLGECARYFACAGGGFLVMAFTLDLEIIIYFVCVQQ
jgi:hypothetical protein